jgi:hypothetical protein
MWAIPEVREPSLQSILLDPAVFHDELDRLDAFAPRHPVRKCVFSPPRTDVPIAALLHQ